MTATGNATAAHTPLWDQHVKAGARMTEFAGFELPVDYGHQLAEISACRRGGAAVFDVSHMGRIEVTGLNAGSFLKELLTSSLGSLWPGQVAYTLMLNERAGVIDDLLVAHLGLQRFMLIVNAVNRASVLEHMRTVAMRLEIKRVQWHDVSDQWAMVAVQGRGWMKAVQAVLGPGRWSAMAPMRVKMFEYEGAPVVLSTTGYTGEAGCELMINPALAPALWNGLRGAGAVPAGLGARDTLRLEKGYRLAGQDYTVQNTPPQLRWMWLVDPHKKHYCGREALQAMLEAGAPPQVITGFMCGRSRVPRTGALIYASGRVVGRVSSGAYSPTLEQSLALAWVDRMHAGVGTHLEIDVGGERRIKAVATRTPFLPNHHR